MNYMKPNFKSAQPLAGQDDIRNLEKYGLQKMGKLAREGNVYFKAAIQRLVNSAIIAEGKY